MKVPFLCRVAVCFLCLLLIALSVFAILFSLNVFGEDRMTAWISSVRTDLRSRIILIFAAVVVASLCVYVLRPVRKGDDPLRGTAIISRGEAGGTFISLSAIETMVDRFLDSQSHIREHKTVVSNGSGEVRIDLRLIVADADIAMLSENLHRSLEEYIGSAAGIPVKSIRILIDEADLSGSEPIEDVSLPSSGAGVSEKGLADSSSYAVSGSTDPDDHSSESGDDPDDTTVCL